MPQPMGVLASSGRILGTLPATVGISNGISGTNLIITAVSWTPASPVNGDQVVFSATVKNIGDTPTGLGKVVDVTWYINGFTVNWSDQDSTQLMPGASRIYTANFGPAENPHAYWPAQVGTFTLVAIVNSIGRVDEGANTTDNSFTTTITVTGGGGGGPGSPGDVSTGIAASETIAWLAIGEAYADDATLDDWKNNRKIGAVVLIQNSLRGYGGSYAWTGAAAPTFNGGDGRTGSEWQFHQQIKNSNFVARCHSRGIKVYLGTKLVDLQNTNDHDFYPHDIHDSAYWATYVSSGQPDGLGLWNLARAAYNLGCDGVGLDPEPTPTNNGSQQTWNWNFTGNTHTQAATRAQVKSTGAAIGAMFWDAFPGADIVEYFPTSQMLRHTWEEDFNAVAAGDGGSYGNGTVFTNACVDEWIDGVFSVPGYGNFYILDSLFYRNSFLGGPSGWLWPAAIRYSCLNLFARISQQYSRPDLLLPKLRYCPFIWLDGDEVSGAGAIDSGTALYDEQWNNQLGMRATGLYDQNWETNYGPWLTALAAAASTSAPDSTLPTFTVAPTAPGGGTTKSLSGTAQHLGYGVIYAEWILYENDGTTMVSAGMCVHQFIIGSKIYNVNDGYTNGSFPFTATVPNGVSGRKLTVTAVTPLGQQHSATVNL